MPRQIPTFESVEGRLAADPRLEHTADGTPYVRVRITAEPKPEYQGDGTFVQGERVECFLVARGKAALCLARRFRFGDVVLASGHVSARGAATFIARRIGHDAARTDYTVTRARRRRANRADRRSAARRTRDAGRPGTAITACQSVPGPSAPVA